MHRVKGTSRGLVTVCSAVVALGLVTGTLSADAPPPSMVADSAPALAVRGARYQLAPLPPPPFACTPGTVVRGVDMGDSKVIAFSFDDGPWPTNTAAVMSAFEARGLRATFFMIGINVQQYPSIARDAVNRGHEVANHSMTHTYTTSTQEREVLQASATIQGITGVWPTLYRSPGLDVSDYLLSYLRSIGYCDIFTTVVLNDQLMPRLSSSELCSRFAGTAHPGEIVLLHDGGSHAQTVQAVPCMLSVALSRGYQLVTVSELLQMGPSYSGARPRTSGLEPDNGSGNAPASLDE